MAKAKDEIEAAHVQRVRVYDIANTFSAASQFRFMLDHGFSPEWDNRLSEAGATAFGITVPEHEVLRLRVLQEQSPQIWGAPSQAEHHSVGPITNKLQKAMGTPFVASAGEPPAGWQYADEATNDGFNQWGDKPYLAAFMTTEGGDGNPAYGLSILWDDAQKHFIPAHGSVVMPDRTPTAAMAAEIALQWYEAETGKTRQAIHAPTVASGTPSQPQPQPANSNGEVNRAFLAATDATTRTKVLGEIAAHYGITEKEAFDEVVDQNAEHLLDYLRGATRSATSVLMQRHKDTPPPIFKSDVPSDQWLEEKQRWSDEDGRNQWGVPKTFGPITGSFNRPLNLPIALLAGTPGERGEQANVRQESLQYIRDNFDRVTQDPVYVEVDPHGKAWVSEGNHRIMVAAEKGVPSLPTEVRYFSGGERKATDFAPATLIVMDSNKAALNANVPKLVVETVKRVNYIEPGDTFSERPDNGRGVLGAGVITAVNREIDMVYFKHLSGALQGVERSENASHECFNDIVAGRIRHEQREAPQEPTLFAIGDELRLADRVSLYAPVRYGTSADCMAAVLRRSGLHDFAGPISRTVRTDDGLSFFDGISAPGNSTTYTYMLMREVGILDRANGQFIASEEKQLIGMTKWDRTEVDQRPGLYYVNAQKDGETKENALLLGPFPSHIDALLKVHAASNHVANLNSDGVWLSYGTVKVDTTADEAPRGRLNDVLLAAHERAALPGTQRPPATADATIDSMEP